MKLKEFVRNPYNYDVDDVSDATGLKCEDKSLAQQQFKEEADINYIAKRYNLTGEMPQLPNGFDWGADFEGIFDFQTAQNAVVAGKQAFMALPAKLRARFQNDPQELMAFLEDDDNQAEARKLGLLRPIEPTPSTGAPKADTEGEPPSPTAKPAGAPTPKSDT